MSRIYPVTATFSLTAAGTDCDLLSLAPASNKPIRLLGFMLSQGSEVGDAQEEGIRITVRKIGTFNAGSGGNAVSASLPLADVSSPLWSFTARSNDTTPALPTSPDQNYIAHDFWWNERNTPYDFWWPDKSLCPSVPNGWAIVIRNETTVADDIGSFSITAWVEEEG